MTFALAFAPRDKLSASISEYNIHPDFCVSLGPGTLLWYSVPRMTSFSRTRLGLKILSPAPIVWRLFFDG